jgi:hypothetical protein
MGRPEERAEETVGETVGETEKETAVLSEKATTAATAGKTDSMAQSRKGDSSSSSSSSHRGRTKVKTKKNKRNNGFVSNGDASRPGRSHMDDEFMAELGRVNAALEAERGERERILHADWALLDVSPTVPLPVDAVPYTGKGGWQTIVSTKKTTDTAKGAKGAPEMEAEASGDVGNKDAADNHETRASTRKMRKTSETRETRETRNGEGGRSGNATVDDAETAEDAESDTESDADDGTYDHASLPTLLELDERHRIHAEAAVGGAVSIGVVLKESAVTSARERALLIRNISLIFKSWRSELNVSAAMDSSYWRGENEAYVGEHIHIPLAGPYSIWFIQYIQLHTHTRH